MKRNVTDTCAPASHAARKPTPRRRLQHGQQTLESMGKIIGHRGVAALAPENTLESFALAHHYGLKAVEFDVILSADGEAFVFHDLSLDRTTNAHGEFALTSSSVLKTLDAGSWFAKRYEGAKIPTLRDALLWLRQHQMTANIEIKPYPGYTYETVHAVLDHLEELWPGNMPLPLVSSFESDVLRLCHRLHKDLPLGYLMDKWVPQEIEFAQSLQCVAMNINHRIANPSRIQMLKKRGFGVYVYTVNYQFLISRYFAWGVDGIFSDYPSWKI